MTSSNSLVQHIRICWWAVLKLDENPSQPNGAWRGVRKTTSCATNVSRRARSPALTASIKIECTVRISRSSDAIACHVAQQVIIQICRSCCFGVICERLLSTDEKLYLHQGHIYPV